MTSWLRDYTVQSIFVALQATIIVYGVLVTATFLKANGYPEWDHFAWYSKFVRHAGLVFFLVPAGWVWLTIWYDRSDRLYPMLFTIGTGIAVLVLLFQIFSTSAAGADRKIRLLDYTAIQQVSPKLAEQDEATNILHRWTFVRFSASLNQVNQF